MTLYARLDNNGYINGFSDTENEIFNTEFEIEEEEFHKLSACSGQCYKIEEGLAVKKKDVDAYLSEWDTKRQNTERIKVLKNMLAETDYKAIKFAEGIIPPEEYESIKQQRQAWRDEINILEVDLE